MSNVIRFTGITTLSLDADHVLESALGKLDGVVVVGFDKDGQEYFASSYADGGDVLWLFERAKKKLLEMPDDLG